MPQFEQELQLWINKEKAAIELSNVVGHLWLDKSIELMLFRRPLFDVSITEILNDHLFAKKYVKESNLDVFLTLKLAKALSEIEIAPSRIDIGRLAKEFIEEKADEKDIDLFLKTKLKNHLGHESFELKPKDVVLYGFGRIGRIAARILIGNAGKGEQLRLRAIVTRTNSDEDIIKRASLLRKDSIHGKFGGTIIEDLENKALIINGHIVKMIAANSPAEINYNDYGIKSALLIDNTGVWRDREGLSAHLKSTGIDKILLTAPGKGDVPNIVHGINHQEFDISKERIYSAASCTTNAIVPVLKVTDDAFGIEDGHIETVHAYTNDQNLLDNFHKKFRRGRSAPLNMVITETGAASAVTKILPELDGKLTANAVRVPVPNASLAILHLGFSKKVTVEEVNETLKRAALEGNLVEQIDFSISTEMVSSDIVGNPHALIVDSKATLVSKDGKKAVIYAWYDNEYGYTRQVIRLSKYLSGVRRLRYY